MMGSLMKSLSLTQKNLLKIDPGKYLKLEANEMKKIDKFTTGLIVGSYNSQKTGDCVYDVALVEGELLLIPPPREVNVK